ncbi:phosphatase PAP2 family protein [Micromonospora mirobrigensis]|uniref:PAP2 superfamily protein n=1 Tax=Micromonospora mirobrigensis TaxID=262898 RepID=A0A1C4W8X1_9ACTN|nr:PAP2 superfamily protein [Micromonospora mirobrigensis]
MSEAVGVSTRTGKDRAARLVTEVFAPAVWAAAMPLVVAVQAAGWVRGPLWGLLAVFFSAALPYAVVRLAVRRGRLTDHHIGVREQRRGPLLFGMVCVLVGLALLTAFDAPRQLVAMVVVILAVLAVVTAVNQVWKLSVHCAVAAASVTVLAVLLGPALLAGYPLVALVAWSRVRLGDHTRAQVVAGTVAGVAVAAPVFLALV